MKKPASLKQWVNIFLGERHMLGYKNDKDRKYLNCLMRFMDAYAPGQVLTDDLILHWSSIGKGDPVIRRTRLRVFFQWLSQRDLRIRLRDDLFRHAPYRRAHPYIYDPEEITALIDATKQERNQGGPFWNQTLAVLIGLLAASGLRISEALRLTVDDVDFTVGTLHIRESKNVALRIVPLHESTIRALRDYVQQRNENYPNPGAPNFFLSCYGKRLSYNTFAKSFRRCRRRAGLPFRSHPRAPRIHDLRHTFACRHLLRAYQENRDINRAVADLAVYFGHQRLVHVYWYLSAVPELLALCGDRFQCYVENARAGGKP